MVALPFAPGVEVPMQMYHISRNLDRAFLLALTAQTPF